MSEQCETLGCENPPVEAGYCAECADISPNLLDSDHDEGQPTDSPAEGEYSPVEGQTRGANPGFKAGESGRRSGAVGAVASAREMRRLLAERFREAGIRADRFGNVDEGTKICRQSHDDPSAWKPWDSSRISGDYAIESGDGLIEIDVDNHDIPTPVLDELTDTLTVESPHTPEGDAGHRLFAVDDDEVLAVAKEIADSDTGNLQLAWGEIRFDAQYVVGPGSQLDGCDKDYCHECAKPDGGHYLLTDDRPIATLTPEQFRDLLEKDEERGRADSSGDRDDDGDSERYGDFTGYRENPPEDRPRCYHAALLARESGGAKTNAHMVNFYAAALGFTAGYDKSEILSDFREYSGGGGTPFDREETAYHLNQIQDRYGFIKEKTLQFDGILGPEGCEPDCPIHGREHFDSGEGDREPVVVLPKLSPKARAKAWGGLSQDERSGGVTLPQQELYDRVHDAIADSMRRHDQSVIDAIMGGGKTFNFFRALATRDEPGAYFSPRIELYEQAVEYAQANGFDRGDCYILPSLKRDCPAWKGEYGPEQEHLVKSLYALGVRPKTIHSLLGDDLGCRQDGKCEYEHRCDFDPDEYPLLIGHYTHAHLPHVTSGRHCAFDEDPAAAFTARIEGVQLTKGVNAFLDLHDSPPFDGWDDLIQHRNDSERRQVGLDWFDTAENGDGFDFDEPDEQNAVRFKDEGFHAYAPHAVYAILAADPLEPGYPFEQASMPGFGDSARFFTTSEEHGDYYVELQTPPDLQYANAIIALDGTPLVHDGNAIEWENALDRPLNHRQVLTDDERSTFLSETQGNIYIQSSPHIKPYSSGRYTTPQLDAAKLAALRDVYGGGNPAMVFTDKKVCEQYEEAGFERKNLAAGFDYPGNLRGSDEYGDTRLAVQLGSSHHGDHELRRRAAALGETVEPTGKGIERDYGNDLGNAILYQMREAQSAQNALRVGRDGNGAVFVFDTCAFPDWIPVEDELADVSRWTDTEHAIRETWAGFDATDRRDGVTTACVTEAVEGIGERQVRYALSQFAAKGYLSKERDRDDGRRMLWCDDGLGDLGAADPAEIEFPDIDLDALGTDDEVGEDVEVPADSRIVVFTQNRRNLAPDERGAHEPARAGPDTASETAGGGGPPPDMAD